VAGLWFTPSTNTYIKIDVADIGNTHISAPIQHINNYKRCTLLKTGEFLDLMDGQLYIYNYDESPEKKLKNEGYVGYLSYVEGIEAGAFFVSIYVSKEEFNRIVKILSTGNKLVQIDIDTPLHGEDLRYGLLPDSPIEWNTEINNWVFIEKCGFKFEFCNNIKL